MTRTILLVLSLATIAAAPPARFASPWQPWHSADGQVALLRPLTVQPTTADKPLGSLMSSGWRLLWDGSKPTPGKVEVRLVLPVRPDAPLKTASEVLQVGASRDPATVRSCATYGLKGGSAKRLPERTIGGVRFAAWSNGDAGMSQSIAATDLRAVVAGTCYAVERFRYGESASDGDPAVTIPAAQGAAMLDRSLASLRLGPAARRDPPMPPAMHPPAHTVAR